MPRAIAAGFRFRVSSAIVLVSLAAAGPAAAQGFSQPGQAPGAGAEATPPPAAHPPPSGMSHLPTLPPPPDFGAPSAGTPGAGAPPGGIGFGAPPSQAIQPARPNYADELTDFGVPPQATLQVNVASETPLTIPGGHVITTNEMRQAVGSDVLFFDVWQAAPHPTIPGAIALPGAGSPGSFDDNVQRQLWAVLAQSTNRQPQRPIVFFCTGSRCWESYNAALRAINMGFKVVLWYRGGLGAWQAAGQPTAFPSQGQPQQGGAGSTQ